MTLHFSIFIFGHFFAVRFEAPFGLSFRHVELPVVVIELDFAAVEAAAVADALAAAAAPAGEPGDDELVFEDWDEEAAAAEWLASLTGKPADEEDGFDAEYWDALAEKHWAQRMAEEGINVW